jgi:hypothetical protein
MTRTLSRFSQALLALAVVFALMLTAVPMLGGHDVEAGKKKPKTPNIAIQSIVLQPHADPGHKTVVVTVANVGKRNANGFRIGMQATRSDGTVRTEEFSLPLSVAKGTSTTVEFRLGCNWINGGAVVARTDPSPVPGEPANKTANNVLTQAFGNECPLP